MIISETTGTMGAVLDMVMEPAMDPWAHHRMDQVLMPLNHMEGAPCVSASLAEVPGTPRMVGGPMAIERCVILTHYGLTIDAVTCRWTLNVVEVIGVFTPKIVDHSFKLR